MNKFDAKKFEGYDNEYWVGELDEEGHYNSLAMCWYQDSSSIYYGEVKNDFPNGYGVFINRSNSFIYTIGKCHADGQFRYLDCGITQKNHDIKIIRYTKDSNHLIILKNGSWLYGNFICDSFKINIASNGYYFDAELGCLFYIVCKNGVINNIYPIYKNKELKLKVSFTYIINSALSYTFKDFNHGFVKRTGVNKQGLSWEWSGMFSNEKENGIGTSYWSNGERYIGWYLDDKKIAGFHFFSNGVIEYINFDGATEDYLRNGWCATFESDVLTLKEYNNDNVTGNKLVIKNQSLDIDFNSKMSGLLINDKGVSIYKNKKAKNDDADWEKLDSLSIENNNPKGIKNYLNNCVLFSKELNIDLQFDKNEIIRKIEALND